MEASNLAAIFGSMAIITSFLVFMTVFLSWTCWNTQLLKPSPRTAAKTLTSHYLGIFGMSISSGKYIAITGLSEAYSRILSTDKFLYCGT